MVKILLLVLSLLCGGLVSAQLIQKEDGRYYDTRGELYSGTYYEYYPSGVKRIEMNVLNGMKDGETKLFYENEQIQEIRVFKANAMHGQWITYNEQGVKVGVASYADGLKDGKWEIYDDKGVKRYEMFYKKGAKAGVWRIWDEAGNLVSEKKY